MSNFWSPGFWAPGFWSAGFWGEEETGPGFKPFQVGYGFLPRPPARRQPTLREATAAIFGDDWDRDIGEPQKIAPRSTVQAVAASADAQKTAKAQEARSQSERNANAMRTHQPLIDRDVVKRILDTARRNAQVARDLELEQKRANMLLLMMMEM